MRKVEFLRRAHLVILKRRNLIAILRGEKTIESRFMKTRRAPFAKIEVGEKLFFKQTAGPVRATGEVARVMGFEGLTVRLVGQIKRQYGRYILGTDEYWKEKQHAQHAVLVWLRNVREIGAMRIDKRDRSAWVVLTAKRNYGLL